MSFNLYDSQKLIIEKLKILFENKGNILIDSPTGSGKTLALITSIIEQRKIFYVSRTHTQLNQMIEQLQLYYKLNEKEENKNAIIIGSRNLYCIKYESANVENLNLFCKNSKCELRNFKEVQNDITESSSDYYSGLMKKIKILEKTEIFSTEDLIKKGTGDEINTRFNIDNIKNSINSNKFTFCPYYFMKNFIKKDNLILGITYNSILCESIRKTLEIDIKDSIIIFDEAHNLFPILTAINTVELSIKKLWEFNKKIVHNKINKIIKALLKLTDDNLESIFINDFLFKYDIYNINTLNILNDNLFKQLIKIYQNIGFIQNFILFLRQLTVSENNCKIYVNKTTIKFLPFNLSPYMDEFKSAKNLVLIGGTMEPSNLLSSIDIFKNIKKLYVESNIENLKLNLIEKINGKVINSSFKTVEKSILIYEKFLRKLISERKNIVVFFPSYKLLHIVRDILGEEILLNYQEYKIKKTVLFAVLNGELSEGINFNDDLCRTLIIIGLPFEKPSIEITDISNYYTKFKINYQLIKAFTIINQTLGRAVRHKNDYAEIFLVDERYKKSKDMIIEWMRKKIIFTGNYII